MAHLAGVRNLRDEESPGPALEEIELARDQGRSFRTEFHVLSQELAKWTWLAGQGSR